MPYSLSKVKVNHLYNRNDWLLQKYINKRTSSDHRHTVSIAQNSVSSMKQEEHVKGEWIYLQYLLNIGSQLKTERTHAGLSIGQADRKQKRQLFVVAKVRTQAILCVPATRIQMSPAFAVIYTPYLASRYLRILSYKPAYYYRQRTHWIQAKKSSKNTFQTITLWQTVLVPDATTPNIFI